MRNQAPSPHRASVLLVATGLIAAILPAAALAAPPAPSFTPQVRLGYTSGDQWEPAIAADRAGHVYVLHPQYLGVPDCPDCADPTMILQVSADRGRSWGPPHPISPVGAAQYDAQIAVDPVDGETVYASWLDKVKSDIAVARSTDFGATWSVTIADDTKAATDKPILAVRGSDVYVAYNHAQTIWASSSHDGGATFDSVKIQSTAKGKLGWSLASGGTVTTNGDVHFGWAGYEQNGGAKGPVNLFVSTSTDAGATWATRVIDVSGAPPDCSAYRCGWAFLGAQVALASDAGGTLFALWNAGKFDGAPERMFFARSTDGGATWSPAFDVSAARSGVHHAFPAIDAAAAGDVRIAWMDARVAGGTLWNTYYRSSADGGRSFSAEVDISTFVPGFSYILPDGYRFPFGDYFELSIDDRNTTHAVWGEGFDYVGPGSIWYARG